MEWNELFTKKYKYFFVNESKNDPCLYIFDTLRGRACVFDIGDISSISLRDLLKVDYLFISHTHMDHFIGFDDLVRINIPQFKKLIIVGPEGIAQNIYHRLSSYSWNLLEKDQINFLVKEVYSNNKIKTYSILSSLRFVPKLLNEYHKDSQDLLEPVLKLENSDRIYATVLDHGIDSVGYLYKCNSKFKINSKKLEDLGFIPGPWLKELIVKIESAQFNESVDLLLKDQTKKKYRIDYLYHSFVEPQPEKSFGYVSDFYFSQSNIKKIHSLFFGVDLLFCESTFMSNDYKKAYIKKHLTTKQAALLGAYARVDRMIIFHFSKSYPDSSMIQEEFDSYFNQYKKLDEKGVKDLIQEELELLSSISD